MKLDAIDGKILVPQAHDLSLGRFRRDLEAVGQGVAFHDEGVVAGRLEGRFDPFEKILPVVNHRRGLPVHEPVGPDHIAAEDFADALVPETDAEERDRGSEGADDITADPGFGRCARSGGDANSFGRLLPDLIESDAIIPMHLHCSPQLSEILDEIVGERIVVVDDEEHVGRMYFGDA